MLPQTLKKIEIYIDKRGDHVCPYCKAQVKDENLKPPRLTNNRTTLILAGHCQDCGSDFRFEYVLWLSDIHFR